MKCNDFDGCVSSGNIPAGDVAKGELLCSYLQPFPPSGTGYHRHVFLLFKQEGHIDYSQEGVNEPRWDMGTVFKPLTAGAAYNRVFIFISTLSTTF